MWLFEWKVKGLIMKAVKAAKHKDRIESPIFPLRDGSIKIGIYPQGYFTKGNIDICVGDATNVTFAKLELVILVSLLEINKSATKSIKIHNYADWVELTVPDAPSTMLDACDVLTIKVEAEVTHATDADGNDITHLYTNEEERKEPASNKPVSATQISSKDTEPAQLKLQQATLDSIVSQIQELSTKIQSFENRLNVIELKVNEEKKVNNDDRIDQIIKEMQSMKQNIAQLSPNINSNPEQQKLKSWLENNVKLPQYYETFVENGIDDLDTVKLLTMETIKGMGIDKIGHQMKILNQVTKLKQNNNGESDTAYIY